MSTLVTVIPCEPFPKEANPRHARKLVLCYRQIETNDETLQRTFLLVAIFGIPIVPRYGVPL